MMSRMFDGPVGFVVYASSVVLIPLLTVAAIAHSVSAPPQVDDNVLRVDFEDVSCFCIGRQSCSRDGGISCVMR
jgi:hypothetical protein